MTEMTLLIVLVSVLVYYAIGALVAWRSLPRNWAVARNQWSCEESIRCSVKSMTVGMFAGWPVYLTVIAVSRFLGAVIDTRDPEAMKEKIAERDARIRELERELGRWNP